MTYLCLLYLPNLVKFHRDQKNTSFGPPNGGELEGKSLISGISRLVQTCNLARPNSIFSATQTNRSEMIYVSNTRPGCVLMEIDPDPGFVVYSNLKVA